MTSIHYKCKNIHTLNAKSKYRKIKMTYVQSGVPNEDQVNKAFDILFEEVLKNKEDERE